MMSVGETVKHSIFEDCWDAGAELPNRTCSERHRVWVVDERRPTASGPLHAFEVDRTEHR